MLSYLIYNNTLTNIILENLIHLLANIKIQLDFTQKTAVSARCSCCAKSKEDSKTTQYINSLTTVCSHTPWLKWTSLSMCQGCKHLLCKSRPFWTLFIECSSGNWIEKRNLKAHIYLTELFLSALILYVFAFISRANKNDALGSSGETVSLFDLGLG